MNLIAILDFFILVISLISLILLLIGWKNQFSLITRLSLIGVLCIVSFYYLSNFLEWSEISDIFINIEDYVAILAPLTWFFFIYTYLQKKSEINLLENQQNLEGAYRYTEFYKDLFTHDIRNILQNILLADNIIESTNTDDEKLNKTNEILTMIKEQVLRGENLILNVTKLSEIRKSPLPIQSVDLNKILDKIIEDMMELYNHRELSIQHFKEDKTFFVKANVLLQDLIVNILVNAIMHNENRIIEVQIKASKYTINQTRYIKLEFIDNGIGIPDDRKNDLFITREEEEYKFRTGLGLSLIKKIVESYKGKIWVEDKIQGNHSKGSNFILLIPEV